MTIAETVADAHPERFPAAHGISYRPEIDGLRAIAVVSVILYHAAIFPFGGGYVGVDIFFVISGYLISSIILGDLRRGRFTFADFYERRIRRIFPPLFLVLAVTTVVAIVVLRPQMLRNYGQALAATTGFVSNLYFWLKTGYFEPTSESNPLIHMWSLSVEEQFYLGFPVLLIIAHKWRGARLDWLLAAVFGVSLAWCLYEEQVVPGASFFLTPQRAWELTAGAIVAVTRPRWLDAVTTGRGRYLNVALELAGAAMMFVPLVAYTSQTPFPGKAAIPVVLGTALIILASTERTPIGRVLATRAFVAVGLLSYSAYLWHQPLFAFARVYVPGVMPLWLTGAIFALTFLLAWISWRYVEQPFRTAKKGDYRRVFGIAALATFTFAAIGLTLHVARGFPQRYDPATIALAATMAPSPYRDTCHTEGTSYRNPATACRYLAGKPDWAVLGDSHAIELGYGLAEQLRPTGHAVLHLTFSGCQPALLFKSDNPGCSAWIRDALAYLERDSEVRNVMLAFRHSLHLHGEHRTTYPALPDTGPSFLTDWPADRARAEYWRSFDAIVARLRAAGKTVYVVAPIPELPMMEEEYVFGHRDPTGVTRAYYERRNADILSHLRNLHSVILVDPTRALCGPRACRAIIDGQAMYFDDNHLSVAGARRVIAAALPDAFSRAAGPVPSGSPEPR